MGFQREVTRPREDICDQARQAERNREYEMKRRGLSAGVGELARDNDRPTLSTVLRSEYG